LLHCLGRKGLAAATTLAGVGIGNLEPTGGQAVAEIDHRTSQVLRAKWVDQNDHTLRFAKDVIRPFFIKGHRILHTGATALLNVQTKNFALVLRFLEQGLDLISRSWGDLNYRIALNTYIHIECCIKLGPGGGHVKSQDKRDKRGCD